MNEPTRLEYMNPKQWQKYGIEHGYWGFFRLQVLKEHNQQNRMKNFLFFLVGICGAVILCTVIN